MRLLKLLLLWSLIFSNYALASTVAKVTGVGTYGDSAIFVFFDRSIAHCGNKNRIDLAATHPAKQHVFSVAMAAFVGNKAVAVKCVKGNTFGIGNSSFIYLTNKQP